MLNDVQVRQFEVSEEDALLRFLRVAYPDEPLKSDRAFWQWHFLQNPYVNRDNIPTWIVTTGGEIVGQLAAIPMELKAGANEMRAIWVVNIVVLPEYRKRGLGHRLFQVAHETFSPLMIALGYNEGSGAILRRRRWTEMGRINRYHRLLFPGDAVNELSRLGQLRALANLLYAPFRPRRSQLLQTRGEVRAVTQFDASFDNLWREARIQWPCAVARTSRFLEWQFMLQPGKKFDVLGYYERGRLLGYIVLFFRRAGRGGISHKAAISDLCYSASDPVEVIDGLLKAALSLALERRVGSLVTDVLDARVEQRLRHFGFRPIKNSPGFMVGPDGPQDLMTERSNWFLTRGDSDVSIFEEPNI